MDEELELTEAEHEARGAGEPLPYPDDPHEDDGATSETEHEAETPTAPEEAADPPAEPDHPETTPDEGGPA